MIKWILECDEDLMFLSVLTLSEIQKGIAKTWGIIIGETESQGMKILSIDRLLGATPIAHDLTVVTGNTSDIKKTQAKILNPWEL